MALLTRTLDHQLSHGGNGCPMSQFQQMASYFTMINRFWWLHPSPHHAKVTMMALTNVIDGRSSCKTIQHQSLGSVSVNSASRAVLTAHTVS